MKARVKRERKKLKRRKWTKWMVIDRKQIVGLEQREKVGSLSGRRREGKGWH